MVLILQVEFMVFYLETCTVKPYWSTRRKQLHDGNRHTEVTYKAYLNVYIDILRNAYLNNKCNSVCFGTCHTYRRFLHSLVQDWCKDGLVVRAVVSHQSAQGWNPGSDSISGLSLLLDVAFASRGFFPGPPVFPSSQITALLKFQLTVICSQ